MATLFSEEPPGEPPTSTEFVVERARQARRVVRDTRGLLEQAERERSFWDQLDKAVSRDLPGSVIYLLHRNDDFVTQLRERKDPDVERLTGLLAVARERVALTVRGLGRSFPQAAKEAGLKIDPSSRHPTYTFADGYVTVQLDERGFIARLSTREGFEQTVGLDLAPLIEEITQLMNRIFGRELKAEPFLRSLRTAYVAVLRADGLADGTEVPIRRVLHRLTKNLKRFSADEFNVDLGRCVKTGDTTLEGRKLHLNHTRNTRQGMLLHGLEQGGYVGFISFKKVDQS